MKILKFLFKVIKLWGIKNTFRIILGEVIFLFKDNKFYFEKIKGLNAHIPTPKFVLDEIYYQITIFYENRPIKIRKIIILEDSKRLEISFFDHKNLEFFDKKFFSMVDPYLNQ